MLDGIVDAAIDDMRERSKNKLYQTDFAAWKADVLGLYTYEKMNQIMDTALFGEKNLTVVKSSNGSSKDLALDTPILTTDGWKTMGTVEVGDFVYSEEGEPIEVVWKSEVFNKPSYRVVFDDHSELITSDSHEWNTLDLKERNNVKTSDWREHWDKSSVVTTGEIQSTLTSGKQNTRNHLVPITKPVEFPEKEQILEPYALGVWLGDGTAIRAEINVDDERDPCVMQGIRDLGYNVIQSKSCRFSFSFERNVRGLQNVPKSDFKQKLDDLGVIGNKHIPDEYLYGSIEQRKDLLRGLMDTDGWAEQRGSLVGFSQSNYDLIMQFTELISSLGIKYSFGKWQPEIGNMSYVVRFNPHFDPFTPGSRKSKVFTSSPQAQKSRHSGRTIVAVEEIPSVPTQCIQVDSERHLYLAGKNLIPTHNSFEVAAGIVWASSVFPVGEATNIVSAPSARQIYEVVFGYLKMHYGTARTRGFQLPGKINDSYQEPAWRAKGPAGNNITLVTGSAPNPSDAVSKFQGIRNPHGRTFVWFDEAGGMAPEMFTAVHAVITGKDARFMGIGNPDHTGTEFHRIYLEPEDTTMFNRETISSFDLPTLTGERVYPRTPEGDIMEQRMLNSLTQADWVEKMKVLWGEDDARYQSKVLGEFSSLGSNTFFKQNEIDEATGTDIELQGAPVLGMDVGAEGEDETVIYGNWNGHVRFVDAWVRNDSYESAQRVHEIAKDLGAKALVIDAVGVGGGVVAALHRSAEFADGQYDIVSVSGGERSPEPLQWANMRTYNHEQFRKLMAEGSLDLDLGDKELMTQLEAITYEINSRTGRVQITPKDKLRKALGRSPDRLDAAIYSTVMDAQGAEEPHYEPGDIVVLDAVVEYDLEVLNAAGRPF